MHNLTCNLNMDFTFSGKRACVAENFTMLQVFLFLTTMIKNFHMSLVNDSQERNEPSFSGKLLVMFEPRN